MLAEVLVFDNSRLNLVEQVAKDDSISQVHGQIFWTNGGGREKLVICWNHLAFLQPSDAFLPVVAVLHLVERWLFKS